MLQKGTSLNVMYLVIKGEGNFTSKKERAMTIDVSVCKKDNSKNILPLGCFYI